MNINFSIITVTYNSKEDLLKTIKSVQAQTNSNFIHIIKDGLSNDKTDEIDFSEFRNFNSKHIASTKVFFGFEDIEAKNRTLQDACRTPSQYLPLL